MALSTIRGMTVSTHREIELVSSPNGQSSFLHTNQGQAGPSPKKRRRMFIGHQAVSCPLCFEDAIFSLIFPYCPVFEPAKSTNLPPLIRLPNGRFVAIVPVNGSRSPLFCALSTPTPIDALFFSLPLHFLWFKMTEEQQLFRSLIKRVRRELTARKRTTRGGGGGQRGREDGVCMCVFGTICPEHMSPSITFNHLVILSKQRFDLLLAP